MIFYGCSGSGKLTRVYCLLNEIYQTDVRHTNTDMYKIKNNGKEIEISVKFSKFHIEVNPSEVKT